MAKKTKEIQLSHVVELEGELASLFSQAATDNNYYN